jgi:hypothetical protein
MFETKSVERIKTHISYSLSFFFLENLAVCETMSKNIVEPEGPQMMSQCGAYELHDGQARLHSHTHAPGRTRAPNQHKYVIIVAFQRRQ